MRKSSRRSDQRSPPRATLPAAQVHALDPRRVDEDLEPRPRQRQQRHLRRVELERQRRRRGVRRPSHAGSSSCAASRGPPTGSCAGSGPRRGSRPRRSRARSRSPSCSARRARRARSGSNRATNSSTSIAAISGCAEQRPLHVRGRRTRSPPGAGTCAIARMTVISRPVSPAASTSPLNPSSSSSPRHTPRNASWKRLADPLDVLGAATAQAEVVDPHRLARRAGVISYGRSSTTLRAHVLERRQHVRQRHSARS